MKKAPTQAVILAAGESSRFLPFSESGHKSLIVVSGKTIIEHLADGLIKNGVSKIIIIHAPGERGKFEKALQSYKFKITYLTQAKPLGTGNALKLAAPLIKGWFLLINGDHYQSPNHISRIIAKYKYPDKRIRLMTQETERPWEYAIVERKNKNSQDIFNIVEKPAKGKEPSKLRTVGLYLLNLKFIEYIKQEPEHPYSLINAFNKQIEKNGGITVEAAEKTSSIKYAFDLLDAVTDITNNQNKKISKRARIAKNATVKGNVVIEDDAEIMENAVIHGPVYIGRNCVIGNNVVIRKNSVIEDGAMIGTNTEVKHSLIGRGTHIHSGYIGDSVIGENCRIAAGLITGNRRIDRENIKFAVKNNIVDSGKTYLGAIIGNGTKTGIYASTMPGTIIGSDCIIGANTEVKGTIPSESLVYTKQKAIVKKKNGK